MILKTILDKMRIELFISITWLTSFLSFFNNHICEIFKGICQWDLWTQESKEWKLYPSKWPHHLPKLDYILPLWGLFSDWCHFKSIHICSSSFAVTVESHFKSDLHFFLHLLQNGDIPSQVVTCWDLSMCVSYSSNTLEDLATVLLPANLLDPWTSVSGAGAPSQTKGGWSKPET